MFSFKQFDIEDSASGLKVGTDAVLLGAWTSVTGLDSTSSVVDAGAGCGILALMIAQRTDAGCIGAVEIDADACRDCHRNFANSPWHNRLHVYNTDFLTYNPTEKASLIISNPPFFSNGERAAHKARACARHEDMLPISALIDKAAEILADNARLSIVVPSERENDIIWHATLSGLTPSRLCRVYTTPQQTPKRILVELTKGHARYTEEKLYIHDVSGKLSVEFSALVKDFYLKM